MSTCSKSSTPATSHGVAPIAFNKPTRRVCSTMRPPTRMATLRDGQERQQPAPRLEDLLHLGEGLRIPVADVLPGEEERSGRGGVRVVVVGERRSGCGILEPQVQEVGIRSKGPGNVRRIGLGGPDQARVVRSHLVRQETAFGLRAQVRVGGNGGGDRHSNHAERGAADAEPIARVQSEHARETSLDDHPARAHPATLQQPWLIDYRHRGVPALDLNAAGGVPRPKQPPRDGERPAVRDHARGARERHECRSAWLVTALLSRWCRLAWRWSPARGRSIQP